MISVNDKKTYSLVIGRAGENEVESFSFDVSPWVEQYGEGSLYISIKRPGDTEPYIRALTITDGVAVFYVTNVETAKKGYGEAQLVYTVGTTVKKSPMMVLYVKRSVVEDETPPDGWQSWMDALIEIDADIRDVANQIDEKVSDFDADYEIKMGAINSAFDEFDTNAASKTSDFNDNYDAKVGVMDQKLADYNTNAANKTSDFNTNAASKISTMDQKLADYNTNATNKTSDFNTNYTEKKGVIDQTFDEVSDALRQAITVEDDGQGHITLIIGGGSNGGS